MASSQATESLEPSPVGSPPISRGESIAKQRWSSTRASAARKTEPSLSKCTRPSVFGDCPSRTLRATTGKLKIRSVSQVQTFFKERTLSKADAYIRDRTAIEGHIFLKALAPDGPFLEIFKETPFSKESSSSSESYEGILDEELGGMVKKGKDMEAAGIARPPPPPEVLDDVCM